MINYSLHKNHLTNGADNYRAMVQSSRTVDLEGVIDKMIEHGSTITKPDALAVLEDFFTIVERLVLEGCSVLTPLANYSASIKGNFASQIDPFDSSRHRVETIVNPGQQLRRTVQSKAQVRRQEANRPQPKPLQYINPNNGDANNSLTPGGGAKLNGHRLGFDPADPKQGIFLVATDKRENRVEVVMKNTDRELIFLVPPGLTAGGYTMEVRAMFGQSNLRAGALEETLAVT